MDGAKADTAPDEAGGAEKSVPRTFRFHALEWERIEACSEARGMTAAEFVRFAVRAAMEGGAAAPGAADRLAPLVERTFRYAYMVATKMRDDMRAEGRDDEMEALVRTARALQDELTGSSGD